jgi:hypothetical protein
MTSTTTKTSKKYLALVGAAVVAGVLVLTATGTRSPQNNNIAGITGQSCHVSNNMVWRAVHIERIYTADLQDPFLLSLLHPLQFVMLVN